MNVYEAIRTKRATRAFTKGSVPPDSIRRILNAGRLAQSSKNTQPWIFMAVTDRETLARLATCGRYAGHLAGAAWAVAIVSPGAGNDFDLGQAAAYMQLAAWEQGIGSCIASMHDGRKAREILGVPGDMHFVTAISFGYPAEGQRRPGIVRGGRKPFDEVVRWERWSGS